MQPGSLSVRRWYTRIGRRVMAAGLVAIVLSVPPAARACGYENPDDAALGLFNWAYPKSLYVRTAVWQAEDAGVLPARSQTPAAGSLAFFRAAANMSKLGRMIEKEGHGAAATSFAVVLIPAVMWTRFVPGRDGIAVMAHAPGPKDNDAVVVTDEKVVRALVDGMLDVSQAEAYGLLRLYGEESRQAAVRAMLTEAVRSAAMSRFDVRAIEPTDAVSREGQ